jgi:hypothetical protein
MDPLRKVREIEAVQAGLERQLAQGGVSEAERISLNHRLRGLSLVEAALWPHIRQPLPAPFSKEWRAVQWDKFKSDMPFALTAAAAAATTGVVFKWTFRR